MSLMSIDRDTLSDVLAKIKDTKICVVGDFYLDRYSLGIMEVISREAPIPIIRLKSQDSTRYLPGAAGNVALNLADLGAQVSAIGIVGHDHNGRILTDILQERGIDTSGMVEVSDRLTGAFEKFYASAYHSRVQQVARVDTESAKAISSSQEQQIIDNIAAMLQVCDGLVVADYAEILGTGVVTDNVLAFLDKEITASGKVAIGDSRLRVDQFKGLTCVPNDYEAAMAAGIYQSHTSHEIGGEVVIEAGKILVEKLHSDLFITRGEKGIIFFDRQGAYTRVPTVPLDGEIDPTGAGDSVASAIAASLCAGASPVHAAEIANLAARVSVGKVGITGTAKPPEILATRQIIADNGDDA
ncbi:MAG: hypothetical protein K9K66_04160 [Desulfarculaceae bacterium]|nr:hypothetical protein [Desulfarculaceae bacterium]MCF8073236.1 hypothetical protein [Desulfarculaceae bacterium]MCF8100832.1 hypothetical protein [Desulfarculaceae bacterium]MCF8118206.1 hypothetical protein [Desulfarculaceae bacterium]